MTLDELAAQALIGTARRPPRLPAGDDLGAPAGSIEQQLLRRAGTAAICADAGVQPGAALPVVRCPPETRATVDDPAQVAILRACIEDGPAALQLEACALLAAHGAVLPPAVLPQALDNCYSDTPLRTALLPLLGERGHWLAAHRPGWAAAIAALPAADPAAWQDATMQQRYALIENLRRRDPAGARALVQADFVKHGVMERGILLDQFAIGLDAADEDFLQRILATDRSKEIRQRAAELLAQLPHSAYRARMAARLAGCLRHERRLLRRHWVVEAPAAFDTEWKADALEAARPRHEDLGERAWWLYQLARALPPAWWAAQTGMRPAELLAWAEAGDWSAALLRAWVDALLRQPDPEWAAALVARLPLAGGELGGRWVSASLFVDQLPAAARERHWLRLLDCSPQDYPRSMVLEHILAAHHRTQPVPAALAHRILDDIRRQRAQGTLDDDPTLEVRLAEFVCLLPPDDLAAAAGNWPALPADTDPEADCIAYMLATLERRQTLHRHFSPRTSP